MIVNSAVFNSMIVNMWYLTVWLWSLKMCQLSVQFVITHRFLHYRFLTYGFQARTRNMDCNHDDNDEYDYYDFPRRNYDDNDDHNYNFLRRNHDDNDDRCGSTTCCRLRSRGCPGWRTRCATPSHASVTNCHHHFQQTQNHHLMICMFNDSSVHVFGSFSAGLGTLRSEHHNPHHQIIFIRVKTFSVKIVLKLPCPDLTMFKLTTLFIACFGISILCKLFTFPQSKLWVLYVV